MGVRSKVKQQVLAVGGKAVERLLAEPERAKKVAEAVGRVQKGKRVLEEGQEEILHAMQYATCGDYQQIGKQLAGLKRRLRAVEKRVDAVLSNS